MVIEKIAPKMDCRYCHGRGLVRDWVDYGSTVVSMDTLCDCVAEQVQDEESEIEIIYQEDEPDI